MNDNLRYWSVLGKTDPKHTKGFKRSGGFSGTAIKPIYTVEKMTETFGPCGVGWTISKPEFQIVPGDNREVLVFCTVSLRYKDGTNMSGEVWGIGGDKIVTHIKANEQYKRPERWENDDEAFKKAYTDALSNAMKQIGMSADVHMGMFDDNKYVRQMEREFADEPASAPKAQPTKPAPKAAEETPFDEPQGYSDAEATAFIETMQGACNSCMTFLEATNLWKDNKPELSRLMNAYPKRYEELFAWFKAERAKKITEAA